MRYSTTLFVRIARMIPKSMIHNAIAAFNTDRRVRTLGTQDHLWTLLLGHLHGVASLRHLVTLWKDLPELRGCLGMKEPARSTLAVSFLTRIPHPEGAVSHEHPPPAGVSFSGAFPTP